MARQFVSLCSDWKATVTTKALIQARMGSTRLPGKVLRQLAGKPLLQHVVERLSRATTIEEAIVATSEDAQDDPIAEWCDRHGYRCFRGSSHDVLDRYYQAAREFDAEVIVRVTADCPLIDPEIVDESVRAFRDRLPEIDYLRNVNEPPSYPRGVDVEVFTRQGLECVWREDQSEWREHVTPYFYRTEGRFRVHRLAAACDWSSLRLTVDTPEDFALLEEIFTHFGDNHFSWLDLLAAFQEHPHWLQINQHVRQRVA